MLMLKADVLAGVTMTSKEVADLTGKEHRNVMADIRAMLEQLEMEPAGFSASYRAGNGQDQPMFVLPKDLTLTLVSGYSVVMRKTIIDRWMELETAAPALPTPPNFAAALRLAADQQDVIAAQAEQLAAAAPAVSFVDRYVDSTGLMGFRQVAKLLGAKENAFREFLLAEKILYRLGGELAPFSQHLDAGRFAVRAGTADSGHAFSSARFTPKGVTWVAGEFAKHRLGEKG
jgi:phage antirepressor YoqD-like protein